MSESSNLEQKLATLFAERATKASPPDNAWEGILAAVPDATHGSDPVGDEVTDIGHLDEHVSEGRASSTKRSWRSPLVGAAAAAVLVILLLVTQTDDSSKQNIVTDDQEQPDVEDDRPEDGQTLDENGASPTGEEFPSGSVLFSVAASDSLLVAVGADNVYCCATAANGQPVDDSSAAVWTSTDGVNWFRVPHDESVFGGPGGQLMSSVTVTPGGFVAAGIDTGRTQSDAAIWTSPDGLTWSRVPDTEAVLGGAGQQSISIVASSSSGLVALGFDEEYAERGSNGTALWISADGLVWTEVAPGPDLGVDQGPTLGRIRTSVVGAPSGFIAFGSSAVWQSADGTIWSPSSIPPLPSGVSRVIADGDGYLAVDEDEVRVWRLVDGSEWTLQADDGPLLAGATIEALTLFNGGYVGVGLGGEGSEFHGVAGPILNGAAAADSLVVAPTSETGLITAEQWTFAVVVGESSSDAVISIVDEVRGWDGVTDIVQVPATRDAWLAVTGRTDICAPGLTCGEGFVILVADDRSVAHIAPQLEQRYGSFPSDVMVSAAYYSRLIDEYVAEMSLLQGSPEPLFDVTQLGVEQAVVNVEVEESGTFFPPDEDLLPSGRARLEESDVAAAWGIERSTETDDAVSLQLQFSDGAGVGAPEQPPYMIIAGQSDSIAAIGGLPLATSVVATLLSDGTTLWQRPLPGIAVFDTGSNQAVSFTLLDADGLEILSVVLSLGGAGIVEVGDSNG